MAIAMKAGGYGGGAGSGGGINETLPPMVTGLKAKANDKVIALSWNNPTSDHLAGVLVVYNDAKMPDNPADGTEVDAKLETAVTLTGLTNDKEYFIRVFPYNKEGQYQTLLEGATISATPVAISKVLNDNSWETISNIAKFGEGANYWKVGDAKETTVNGVVDGYTFSGSYFPFILGFNHNEAIEGKGIHFSFGKSALTGGKDVAFQGFQMNPSNTNVGGYAASKMFGTCEAFYNILAPELKEVITPCNKWTDNKGGGNDNAGNISGTAVNVFLLAEFEVFGKHHYANSHEQEKQKQYEYYKGAGNKIRYDIRTTENAIFAWLRSANYGNSDSFGYVDNNGLPNGSSASRKFAFAPCFKLGNTGISPVLNDSSWDVISEVAKEGNGANIWKVGDCKEVELTGSVDGYDFTGKHYPFIIGFNHNEVVEGKGIHFSFGKSALSNGKDIAYNGFKMNDTNTNTGGWKGSKMYQTCGKFYNILPEKLKKNIVACNKYTDNKGGGTDTAENVTLTQDNIFVPAEFEIFGAKKYANSAERNKQRQYEHYRLGNNKIRYDAKNNGNAVLVWLRSPHSGYALNFCSIYTDGSASGNNTSDVLAFTPCFKVGASAISPTLNDNPWEVISSVAKEGTGSNFWKIGDVKEVQLSGSASGYNVSGKRYPYIIGFNHNESLEGKGIHFQFGKESLAGGKDVVFNGLKMNNSNVNAGGWNNSVMRKTTCTQFYNTLPADLKPLIVPCTKYTDNTGNTSNTAGAVTATSDNIWILAEFEFFGKRTYANQYEQNKQKQYQYYINGNSKIRYDINSPGNAVRVWLRSAYCDNSLGFCLATTGGSPDASNASGGSGFAPAFKI